MSIALEELKATGSIPGYSTVNIAFSSEDQKQPWFLAVNPNGRIPALIDNREGNKPPLHVWESASILQYLAGAYDKARTFQFEGGSDEQVEMTNWIFFLSVKSSVAAAGARLRCSDWARADAVRVACDGFAVRAASDRCR